MNNETQPDSPPTDIFVARTPIDFTGETRIFDEQVQQEALAQARVATHREFPLMGESRHSHARVFDADRYSVRSYVPETEGEGFWDLYRLSKNVVVMIGDCRYSEPKWLGTPDQGYFKIRLLWSGKLLTAGGEILLDSPKGMLAIYPGRGVGGYYVAAGQPLKAVILHCRISMLLDELGIDPETAPGLLSKLTDTSREEPLLQEFSLTPRITNSVSDILNDRDLYAANLRGWFIEAKAKEVLASVIQGLMHEPDLEAGSNRITHRDRNRILEAQEVIRANLSDLPTIPALSRMVGVNRTKLKSGFKAVVGCTIGEFTRRQQMETAARMLQTSEQPVGDIGYAVGYRHPANFSHAFKRYFGCLPRSMRSRGSRLRAQTATEHDGA